MMRDQLEMVDKTSFDLFNYRLWHRRLWYFIVYVLNLLWYVKGFNEINPSYKYSISHQMDTGIGLTLFDSNIKIK